MSTLTCCPGASALPLVPLPGISPAPATPPSSFPEGKWVQVLDWSGTTSKTLAFTVLATPSTATVKWRRQGSSVSGGSFQGTIDFSIYAIDTQLTVDLWVDDPHVAISVDFKGAIS